MGGRRYIRSQEVLERPLVTLDFVAENIRRRVISPFDGVTSPDLAWDVHRGYQFWTKLRRLGRFCCLDPS